MGLFALITQLIGVHTVLGAFVAGILVGESPILTEEIDDQLRGLVAGLFMPVFFGLAGLTADLTVLKDPQLALLTLGLIAIASIGKAAGAFTGGWFGGLTAPRVDRARDGHERARLDRGHRRHDRPVDGRAEPEPVHHDRRDGLHHHHRDAADAALGAGRLPMRSEEKRGSNARTTSATPSCRTWSASCSRSTQRQGRVRVAPRRSARRLARHAGDGPRHRAGERSRRREPRRKPPRARAERTEKPADPKRRGGRDAVKARRRGGKRRATRDIAEGRRHRAPARRRARRGDRHGGAPRLRPARGRRRADHGAGAAASTMTSRSW